jgi:AraC-like DNA-binding protein
MAGALQRIGYLTLVPKLLSDLGVDPAKILDVSGLPLDGLDHAEGEIAYEAVATLIRACVELTRCGHFGLLLGHRAAAALSPELIADILGRAPTLGTAFSNVLRRQDRLANGGALYLLDQSDTIVCGFAVYQSASNVAAQLNDAAVAVAIGMLRRILAQHEMNAVYACLPRSAPREVGTYAACLGNAIQFGSQHAGLCLPKTLLARELPLAEPLPGEGSPPATDHDLDLAVRLRRTLTVALLSDEFRLDRKVSRLGMPARTFHRRLATHGIGFRAMLDEVRFDIASELLLHSCLNICTVATILRYAETSVFTASFRRWTGCSPTAWQEKHGIDLKRTRHQPRIAGRLRE